MTKCEESQQIHNMNDGTNDGWSLHTFTMDAQPLSFFFFGYPRLGAGTKRARTYERRKPTRGKRSPHTWEIWHTQGSIPGQLREMWGG